MQQIQEEFTKQNRARRIANANAYAMDKAFAPNFRSALHYYTTNHSKLCQEEKVRALMAQVEDMKEVMGRNIQLSMRRAANLERMLQKSEDLEAETQVFYRRSKMAKRRRQRKYYRVYATLVLMVVGIVYMILAAACGWRLNCQSSLSER